MRVLSIPFAGRAGCALALAAITANAHALPPDRIYAKLAPSVLRVVAFDAAGKPFKMGSAVVVGKETVLTNCHVVAQAARFTVGHDNVSIVARLQYVDPARDMCQLTVPNLTAPAVALGDSSTLAVGQHVYALGNPKGLDLTLSDGMVSALRKDANDQLAAIQTTAPISHGSSGGGLFDDEGRLIGLTSAGIEAGQNLGFAVPINWMRDLPARSAVAARNANQAPAHVQPPAPPARADINDTSKLDSFGPSVRASYEKFLARPLPRAFAVGDNGGSYQAWSRVPKDPSDSPDPSVRVVTECEKIHHTRCKLYAVDRTVVYQPG